MGNLNKAIADYEKALKLDPDSVTAYYSRGITRYDKWDLDGALADYNKAIHLRPNYAMAYYGRARIAALKENHTEAIKDFQKYLELAEGMHDSDQTEFIKKAKKMKRELSKEKLTKKKKSK